MREKTHSPMCPWSSGTARELSRHIRSVWRSTTPKNGDANGAVKIPCTFDQDLRSTPELRKAHVAESGEWAKRLDPSAEKKRKACLASSAKTAIGQDIAHLPDNALVSLGLRQIGQYQLSDFCSCWFCRARQTEGSRNSAISHTAPRLTMRLTSAHMRSGDVNFAGKWDSALKVNSALTAHGARATGIELARRVGLFVITFSGTCGNFMTAEMGTCSSRICLQGYPIEILALGALTQIAEMFPSGQWFQRRHHLLRLQHFGRL